MDIIAHRGISAHYHENTMLAFEKALEIEVYGIEVDLHQIEDQFVIFHDFQLDRLAQTPADIADLSLQDISQIRLENKHKIPILTELFELVKGTCMLNLELKHICDPNILLKQIVHYVTQYEGDVVLSSFNHPLLAQLQALIKGTELSQHIKFGALIGHLPATMAQYAVDMQVDIAAIDANLVNLEFVEHAHLHNIKVWSYTVNVETAFIKLKEMGVDAVFSNDPALLTKLA
jgi:glycerophosphoryl diester phosphodiesterase